MIEFYLLKYLVEVKKCENLTKAAENLFLSQSALSRAMQKLEQIIDVELFERKKNSIALNDNGKIFAKSAEEILEKIDDAVEKIRDFDRKNRTISVGSCAPIPMNKIIFLLNQNFPDVSISSALHNDNFLLDGLQNDFFHLVILHKIPQEKKFYFAKCGSEKLFLAVPKTHKFAEKNGVYLEELNGEKILLYSKIGFWYDICKEKAPNAKFLMQSERDVFMELVEVSPFLSFTTDFFIDNGYSRKNCLYKPILNAEVDVIYYCACKFNQKNRFKNLFDNLNFRSVFYPNL